MLHLISNPGKTKHNVKRLSSTGRVMRISKNLSSLTLLSLLASKYQSKDFLSLLLRVAASAQQGVCLHFRTHSPNEAVLNLSKVLPWDTLDGVRIKKSAIDRSTFNKKRKIHITMPFKLIKAYLRVCNQVLSDFIYNQL